MSIKIGSLFSGIGGLELGLERALIEGGIGADIRWQCEIEPYPRQVLARHWPDATRYTDVRTMGKEEELEHADLICGGFPCQDISGAGQQAGFDGERSSLFFELARIVRLIKPRYVVLENVSNILGIDQGRVHGAVLGALAKMGYDAEWGSFRGSESVGAPHHRSRWFCIAYPMQTRVPRFQPPPRAREMRPWGWRGKEDMRAVSERPYESTGSRWPKPLIRRVDDGIPKRVDRVSALGNAVVPQVAEVIGRRIVALEREHS